MMSRAFALVVICAVLLQIQDAAAESCYSCNYERKGSSSAGDYKCRYMTEEDRPAIPTEACTGTCSLSKYESDQFIWIYRYCNPSCVEKELTYGEYKGYQWCCTGDLCNAANQVRHVSAHLLVGALGLALVSLFLNVV